MQYSFSFQYSRIQFSQSTLIYCFKHKEFLFTKLLHWSSSQQFEVQPILKVIQIVYPLLFQKQELLFKVKKKYIDVKMQHNPFITLQVRFIFHFYIGQDSYIIVKSLFRLLEISCLITIPETHLHVKVLYVSFALT